jgi:CMP-N-acetylneuraminic acid synthetase
VQNSSLEIAWTRALAEHDSISGERVAPFLTDELEGFSIDYPEDWRRAEELVSAGAATLPAVPAPSR